MARPMPRRSLIEGSVSPAAISVTVPTSFPGLAQQAADWGNISNRASQFSNMLAEIAGKQAQKQGLAAGAVQAPTYEEIEQAAKLGRPIDLPGDSTSINIYENAVYESALAVTESYYHTAATQAMQEAFTDAQAQAATPESMKEALDAVVDNYTEVFSSVSPTSAAKLHHALIQERNNKFVSYNKTWQTDNRKRIDTATLVSADEVIENLPQVANGYQYNPNISPSWGFDLSRILELQKLHVQFGSRPDGLKIIDEKMNKFDEERLKVIKEFIAESVVNGDFGSHDDAKMGIGDRAGGLREGTFGTDIWADEGGEESNTSSLANTLQHFYSTLTSDDRSDVAALIVKKKGHKINLEEEAIAQADAEMVALHQAQADAIHALLDVPRSTLTEELFKQADQLLKDSTMPQTQGPNVNAHLNKTAIRERIAKLRKEVRDSLTGDDTGPTEAQTRFFEDTYQMITEKRLSKREWLNYMHENREELNESGSVSWTAIDNVYKDLIEASDKEFASWSQDAVDSITKTIKPTYQEEYGAYTDEKLAILVAEKKRLAASLALAFLEELRGVRDRGDDWRTAASIFANDNLLARHRQRALELVKPLLSGLGKETATTVEAIERLADPVSEGTEPEPETVPEPAIVPEVEITPEEKMGDVVLVIGQLTEMLVAGDKRLTEDDYYTAVRNLLSANGIDLGKVGDSNSRLGIWIKEQLGNAQ